MTMTFQKAERKQAKLRLALTGPSGSGKTYGALKVAKGLGGRIAVIDTEQGSASLYSDLVDFDVLELNAPYSPERYIEALDAAVRAGYETVIIDSITHEWSGVGGCLELVDQVAKTTTRGNSWAAWNVVTPRHRKFVDAILTLPAHVIITMRSKTETAQVEDGSKKKVVKMGMKSEQRDGIEYEFTTVLDIIHDGNWATPSKDRTGLFSEPIQLSEAVGANLSKWLNSGSVDKNAPVSQSEIDLAIEEMQGMDNLAMLQSIFGAIWKRSTQDQKDQIKVVYDSKKQSLEAEQNHSTQEEAEA